MAPQKEPQRTPRPLFNSRLPELEEEFARKSKDIDFLRMLHEELSHRSTDWASKLKLQVEATLSRLERPSSPDADGATHTVIAPQPQSRKKPPPPLEQAEPDTLSQRRRPPRLRNTNEPTAILDAWTALEVLSPPSFRRPEDLAGGDRQAVAWLDREPLPWEGSGEKARRNTKLFYQVVLGTVDFEAAIRQLLARYADSRDERPAVRGEAILAVVIVDREGRLVEAPAVSISSFAWGVPKALRDDLAALAEWRRTERLLVEGLDEILRRTDEEGEELRLDRATIMAGWNWLVASLRLPSELVNPPRFAIRSFLHYKNPEPPEPLLLNSFFLKDLDTAKTLFAERKATPIMRRYLGVEVPAKRFDLLRETDALEAAVAPGLIPPARWPGPGRHPLVLLQQAGVNLAFQELRDHGLLAINGPPGTGKTTLLRDLVAGVVAARAEAMAGFEDPSTAFTHSGEKLKAGQAWLHLYHLDPRLKGFEMLVASSNNKAVENISAELPDLKAIAEDAGNLRYFSVLSGALLQRETWGLIAAVLGNAANRSRFKQTFWWDDDVGLSTYLAEAAGTPQLVEVTDPETGSRETRQPRIVTVEVPPRSHEEALNRWRKARAAFRAALEKSRNNLRELARIRELAASLPTLAKEEASAIDAAAAAKKAAAAAEALVQTARAQLAEAQTNLNDTARSLAEHDRIEPGFFVRLFMWRRACEWRSLRAPLVEALNRSTEAHSSASQFLSKAEARLREAGHQQKAAERLENAARSRFAAAQREVEAARQRLGRRFIDAEFFACEHADKHGTAPWLSAEEHRARDDVFVAAMALHTAFAEAAAKPLKHNLGALMSVFGGRTLQTAEKRALMLDLWSSLFLVVPLISTTFASVERMLGDLPQQGLGWLFVDEAGQALPQAAVGALMRSRRAVIVGDPGQIEPIVTLPETLTQIICQDFGVDPDRFNAPNASVQTLADAASPFIAEFLGKHGSRSVGVPLLVHRRCAEPMFGISNAVAYDRLMVYAKTPKHSRIGDVLGPSRWIDVQGSSVEKWCPEEGATALTLLRKLAENRVEPDLYIVTPFVIVADNLRKLLRDSGCLSPWTDDPWQWTSERVGTVHTVQGREAEAVILVLGAPAPAQTGARGWAGGRPNLLNVAVTRAKERLYVIGNRSLWREAGLFRELDARLNAYAPPAESPKDLPHPQNES